jgi:hypothetical protein
LAVVVEKAVDAIVVLLVDRSVEVFTSIPIAAEAVPANIISNANPNSWQMSFDAILLRVKDEAFILFPHILFPQR